MSRKTVAGRQIALICGINVGRTKRVAMADLRTLVEKLGYRDVHTLLNSGNVIFSASPASPEAAVHIENAMAARLGVTVRVIVLSAAELAAIVADNPLLEIASDPSRLLVAVLANPKDRLRLEPLMSQDWSPEALAISGRAAYLWCAAGVIESRVARAVGRILGDAVTMRNWATMTRLNSERGYGGVHQRS